MEILSANRFKLNSLPVAVGAARNDYIPGAMVLDAIELTDDQEWKLRLAFSR